MRDMGTIIYDNIRKRRIELGMSQQQLADLTGYGDRSSIAKIEKGLVDLSQSKLEIFAAALKMKPSDLMGWNQDQNNGQQTGYYINAETAAMAQEIYEDPELRVLLDAKRDLSPEDLDVVINMIKALKAKEK